MKSKTLIAAFAFLMFSSNISFGQNAFQKLGSKIDKAVNKAANGTKKALKRVKKNYPRLRRKQKKDSIKQLMQLIKD